MPRDSSVKLSEEDFRFSGDLAMEHGFGILAAVGYGTRLRPDTELRGEIELGYPHVRHFDRMEEWDLDNHPAPVWDGDPVNG